MRERLDVDERRARLIEVGRQLFEERGLDDVSVEEIAEAAGISKGLLYHYFKSKRGFRLAVVEAAADELLRLTDVPTNPDGIGTGEGLRTAVTAFLMFAEARRRGFRMMVTGAATDPDIEAIVEASRQRIMTRVVEQLGVTDAMPLLQVALRGWVGFAEAATLRWLDGAAVTREELTELLATVLENAVEGCGVELPEPFDERCKGT